MVKNSQPLVSIVTVTYNLIKGGRKDHFRQCVESVQTQDYPNVEHIIVDGASNDGTLDLFKELGLSYTSEPDTGIYNAMNKGARLAKGKYVAFLNSDDYYASSKVVTLAVEALEKSGADFTYAPVQIVDEDGNFKTIEDDRWFNFLKRMPICHQSMFAKTDVILELGGFDESFVIAADYDLIVRAVLNGKRPVRVDEPLVSFRLGGLSSVQRQKSRDESIRVIEKNFGLSHTVATKVFWNKWVPEKTLKEMLAKTVDFPNPEKVLWFNRKRFLIMLLHGIIRLRTRKGKRLFKLFGITIYDESTKK